MNILKGTLYFSKRSDGNNKRRMLYEVIGTSHTKSILKKEYWKTDF
jgi:hypothetical protein